MASWSSRFFRSAIRISDRYSGTNARSNQCRCFRNAHHAPRYLASLIGQTGVMRCNSQATTCSRLWFDPHGTVSSAAAWTPPRLGRARQLMRDKAWPTCVCAPAPALAHWGFSSSACSDSTLCQSLRRESESALMMARETSRRHGQQKRLQPGRLAITTGELLPWRSPSGRVLGVRSAA